MLGKRYIFHTFPEGFASILYKDASKAETAANDMKLTAQDLYQFGIIDGIIKEPAGGAHNDLSMLPSGKGCYRCGSRN